MFDKVLKLFSMKEESFECLKIDLGHDGVDVWMRY